MTKRRTRQRPRRGYSVLTDLKLGETPQDRLNSATPGITRCAWPGCREPMQYSLLREGEPIEQRFGLLCHIHAADVAVAVIQDQKSLNQVKDFFARADAERAIRFEDMRREEERYEAEKAEARQGRDGFVYYLRVGERLKIGYSADVKRRMRAYPPGSQLLAVEPGDLELERQRHQQFAGSRTDGREWFRPTPDLMELVQELVDTYGEPKRFAHQYRSNRQPMRIRRTA